MQRLYGLLQPLLGLDSSSLTAGQMCMRALVVYIAALLMVRLVGNLRFAGKYAAIDIILSITLGSTLSRAINGSVAFFPSLLACTVLVTLHWLLATLTYRSRPLESLIKGQPLTLMEDGQIRHSALRSTHLTEQDLQMVLRSSASLTELGQVSLAVLEPNGNISIIAKSDDSDS